MSHFRLLLFFSPFSFLVFLVFVLLLLIVSAKPQAT